MTASHATPLVSVIVPAFDCADFLADAVGSVRAQGQPDLEIIVVDDGSRDGTPAVIRSLGGGIRPLRQPNQGPASARNAGLALARGRYIAFIDADDLWVDGKLRTQLRAFAAAPDLQVVVGATQRVGAAAADGPGSVAPGLEPFGPVWMLFHVGAALFRREAFDRVGNFDASMRQGEDVDWFMRAREAGMRIAVTSELAQLHRVHGNSLAQAGRDRDRWFVAALKKSLDRRRAGRANAADLPEVPGLADFRPKREAGRE